MDGKLNKDFLHTSISKIFLRMLHSLLHLLQFSNDEDEKRLQCIPAMSDPSPITHEYAVNGLEISRISFSSCYLPEDMKGSNFWSDVRRSGTDLWLWLGDNAYMDGTNMEAKRLKYNAARNVNEGPVKSGNKIPVMATWDDHDCCDDNVRRRKHPEVVEPREERRIRQLPTRHGQGNKQQQASR